MALETTSKNAYHKRQGVIGVQVGPWSVFHEAFSKSISVEIVNDGSRITWITC